MSSDLPTFQTHRKSDKHWEEPRDEHLHALNNKISAILTVDRRYFVLNFGKFHYPRFCGWRPLRHKFKDVISILVVYSNNKKISQLSVYFSLYKFNVHNPQSIIASKVTKPKVCTEDTCTNNCVWGKIFYRYVVIDSQCYPTRVIYIKHDKPHVTLHNVKVSIHLMLTACDGRMHRHEHSNQLTLDHKF